MISIHLSGEIDNTEVAVVNQIAHMPGPVPGLTQDDSNVHYCNSGNLPDNYDTTPGNGSVYYCTHLMPLKLDKVYEVLLIGNQDVSHPIHLHGSCFEVIDMGSLDQLDSGKTAFADADYAPVMKDTVAIPDNGFIRIRFRTLNPGYWLLHCHITAHHLVGMELILKVGEKSDMVPPPADFPTCGNYLAPVIE